MFIQRYGFYMLRFQILRLTLLMFCLASPALFAETKGVIILIPGTWNSMIPGSQRLNHLSQLVEKNPYFSEAIIETIEKENYDYFVVKKLNPFGDLYSNGDQTALEILDWYDRYVPNHDKPITLLAHSMGAAYAIHAIKRLNNLPIKNIVMISAPLEGCFLADAILDNRLSKSFIATLNNVAGESFDFRGLYQATKKEMSFLLEGLNSVNDHAYLKINYFTVASVQHTPPTIFQALQSEYLSPFLTLTSSFTTGASDGLITRDSALYTSQSKTIPVQFQPMPFGGRLDHTEQVLDYRILKALGASHTDFVREEQVRFYKQIISYLP